MKLIKLNLIGIILSLLLILIREIRAEIYVDEKNRPNVETGNGALLGKWQKARDDGSFAAFEGIPYAHVPRRFAPPAPISDWKLTGTRDATKPGPVCPQFDPTNEIIIDETENCLFLNIYVPLQSIPNEDGVFESKNLPVMLWIHGGGFLFGAGSFEGGDYFMSEDVILITINYRLGSLGFLSFGLDDGDKENVGIGGNMGVKDLIMGLKWIQQNIQNFGGNPRDLTIFGESAGGVLVHSLILSPATKNLFHKAVAQSGTLLCPWALKLNVEETAQRLATILNCTAPNSWNPTHVAKCLRSKPIKDLIQADWVISMKGAMFVLALTPTVDPKKAPNLNDFSVLPELPMNLIKNKIENNIRVPFILGHNENEGLTFTAPILKSQEMQNDLNSNWNERITQIFDLQNIFPIERLPSITQTIHDFYFNGKLIDENTAENLTNLFSDFYINRGVRQTAILHAREGENSNIYSYILTHKGQFSLTDVEPKTVVHADDLQYLFPSVMAPRKNWPDLERGTDDDEFSKKLISLWATFAQQGKPKSWREEWLPHGTDGKMKSWFSLKENPKMAVDDVDVQLRMKFWENLFESEGILPLEKEQSCYNCWIFWGVVTIAAMHLIHLII